MSVFVISKEQFIDSINFLIKKQDQENRFNDIIKEISGDGYSFIFSDYTIQLLKLLETVTNDSDGQWIEYWVFDLDFGEKWKPGMVIIKDEDIKLRTVEELWQFLVDNEKERKRRNQE